VLAASLWLGQEIRNPKHEIRNKCEIPNSNDRNESETMLSIPLVVVQAFGDLCFGIPSGFEFRVSDFPPAARRAG
jgi:hypothetical protein